MCKTAKIVATVYYVYNLGQGKGGWGGKESYGALRFLALETKLGSQNYKYV